MFKYRVMKVRIFIFKLVDHDSQTIRKIEIVIHSSNITEWTQKEDDIEGHIGWVVEHARWEMLLKKKVKSILREKIVKSLDDYRIKKEKLFKEKENINLNGDQPTKEHHLRTIKLVEKCMIKCVKGTKPSNWLDIFNYKMIHEQYNYTLNDNMQEEISLSPLRCEGERMVIYQGSTGATKETERGSLASKTKGIVSYNVGTTEKNITGKPTYTLGAPTTVRGTTIPGSTIPETAIPTRIPTNAQLGGDYEDKYYKYKNKYVNLKNRHA
jgi:hypothetical protein